MSNHTKDFMIDMASALEKQADMLRDGGDMTEARELAERAVILTGLAALTTKPSPSQSRTVH